MDTTRRVECTIPVLPVADVGKSLEFYVGKLGFTVDWGGEAGSTICSVSRDSHCLMLSSDLKAGSPAWVWIGLADAALFDDYCRRGVAVRQPPRNFSWAYEMKFADPDGNILWMGTEPRADMPREDDVQGE